MYKFTKSSFVTALADCPRIVWLLEHTDVLIDDSKTYDMVMKKGKEAGQVARSIFGEYVLVDFDNNEQMSEFTKDYINSGEPVICEASFDTSDMFCSVDILKNLGDNHVEIYEVKSSSDTGKIQSRYLMDIAFQVYTVSAAGYTIDSANLIEINPEYVRHGELEIDKLFNIIDVTKMIQPYLDNMYDTLMSLSFMLESDTEPFNNDDLNKLPSSCSNKKCGYWNYCSRDLPKPNVFNLNGWHTKKDIKMECYNEGILSYQELKDSGKLNEEQMVEVDVGLTGEPHIEANKIQEFMQDIYYPLYFLDFETFQLSIPPFDDTHPWQQIPFQYSLHYIEWEGGELKHTEFLGEAGTDPRRALAEQLCRDIPMDVCTTAYNKRFECGVIKELADVYPDLAEHLMNIHDHIVDLMVPFWKLWYYTKEMQNSYSIKFVLPALCPDDPALDYHNLDQVHNGSEAMSAFEDMADMPKDEQLRLRENLLKYCGLDTLAMVKVWEKLKQVVDEKRE